MAYLRHNNKIYYAVFSINGNKKRIRIVKADNSQAKKALEKLEPEYLTDRPDLQQTKDVQ